MCVPLPSPPFHLVSNCQIVSTCLIKSICLYPTSFPQTRVSLNDLHSFKKKRENYTERCSRYVVKVKTQVSGYCIKQNNLLCRTHTHTHTHTPKYTYAGEKSRMIYAKIVIEKELGLVLILYLLCNLCLLILLQGMCISL